MAYIALRPCSFGGEKFYVGDVVPAALIRPEMVRRLITVGVITEVIEPPGMTQNEPEPNIPKAARKPRAKKKTGGETETSSETEAGGETETSGETEAGGETETSGETEDGDV